MSQVKFEIQRALKDPNADIAFLLENFEEHLVNEMDKKIEQVISLMKESLQKPVEVKERIIEKTIEPEIKIDEENLRLKFKTSEGWSDWIDLKSLIENYVKNFTNLHYKIIKESIKMDMEEELKVEIELLLQKYLGEQLESEKEKIEELKEFILKKVKEEINNFSNTILVEKIKDLDEFKKNIEQYVKTELKGEKGEPGLPGPPPRIYQEGLYVKIETPFEKAELDFKPIFEEIKTNYDNFLNEKIETFEEKFRMHIDSVDEAITNRFKEIQKVLKENVKEIKKEIKEKVDTSLKKEVKPLKENIKELTKHIDKLPKEFDKKIAGMKQKIEEEMISKLQEMESKIESNVKILMEQQETVKVPEIELSLEGYKLGIKENGEWKQFVDLSKLVRGTGGSGLGLGELQYRIELGEIETVHVKDPSGNKQVVHEIEFVSPMFQIKFEEDGRAKINIEPFADLLGNWITEEIYINEDGIHEIEVSYPIKVGYQRVYWNGMALKFGENNDYIINGNKIIFNEEIQLMKDDIITVEYLKDV